MRAAIYLRISKDREGTELGVDRQLADCTALAKRLGCTSIQVFSENDTSASSLSRKPRKRYEEMLALVRSGGLDVIIASTSSRLTRRPMEHETLIELAEQHGVRYEFVKSPSFDLNTAQGRLVARILAAADAAEAEQTAERTARETVQRAEQGRPHGGPKMFGVDTDGRTLIDVEADEIRRWCALILAGGSIGSIRRDSGRNHASVLAILRNPRNAGLRVLHGQTYPASNPAIVDEATWRAIVALLAGRELPEHSTARRWIGVGLYRCGVCDQAVKSSYGGRPCYRVYACKKLHGGCGRSWQAERVDAYVDAVIAARMEEPDFADLLAGDDRDVIGSLSKEAAGLRKRLEQLGAEFADDDDADVATLRTATKRLRERIADVEQRQAAAGQTGALAALAGVRDPGRVWLDMDDVRRRAAVVDALCVVRLLPSRRGRPSQDWQPETQIVFDWRPL